MIKVDALLDREGILKSCGIEGHSGAGSRGNDIVCAAVSVLARTCLQVLETKQCLTVRADASERGRLYFEIDRGDKGRGFLEAVGSYLLEGIKSVAEEYPENCTIFIAKEK
ncbi:hypothetical protein AGMMS50212_12640 [Spirochaetia bacterium]|nr:hypothetical protein AGMMS50212_12640 [Spirochaetia bacterium]